MTLSVLESLRVAVEAARDKKAEGVEVLELGDLTSVTDYFLICHGNSSRQVVSDTRSGGFISRGRRLGASNVRQQIQPAAAPLWVLQAAIRLADRRRGGLALLARHWKKPPPTTTR